MVIHLHANAVVRSLFWVKALGRVVVDSFPRVLRFPPSCMKKNATIMPQNYSSQTFLNDSLPVMKWLLLGYPYV